MSNFILSKKREVYIKKALLENWNLNNLRDINARNRSIIEVLLFEKILKKKQNWIENKIDSDFFDDCLSEINGKWE